MKYFSILLVVLLLSFAQTNAQSAVHFDTYFYRSGCDLWCGMTEYFNSYQKSELAYACGSGGFFVRFDIDSAKRVSKILFNDGAPQFMYGFVTNALKTTDKYWTSAAVGKTFLLPIEYSLERKCSEIGIQEGFDLVRNFKPTDKGLKFEGIRDMGYNLYHILDFHSAEDSSWMYRPAMFAPHSPGATLECTILSTLRLADPRVVKDDFTVPVPKKN